MKKISFIFAFVITLSACGGGGGSEPTPPPTPTPTPTNSAPELSLTESSIDIIERNSASVGVQASDPDGDSFEVTATTTNSFFDVTYNNGQLEITTSVVDQNESGTITVTATDSNNNSTSATLNVTVLDTVVNLSLSTTSVEIEERQSSVIGVTVDPGVTVVAETTSSFIDAQFVNGQVEITTSLVDQNESGTITVTATDQNNESTSVDVNVTVLDVLPPTAPPVFTLVDEVETGLTPNYLVKSRTRHTIPFNLELDPLIPTDNVQDMFSFDVTGVNVQGLDVDFQFNVNVEGGFIELTAPIQRANPSFNVDVTVDDGFNSTTQNFLVEIADVIQYIKIVPSRKNVTLLGSEEEIVKIDLLYSSQESTSFSVEYDNPSDAEDNPLNMDINSDGVLTLSANGSYDERYVDVRVWAGEGIDQVGIRIDVLMKDGYTQREMEFITQLEDYLNTTQYAFEYEAINKYIADYYLASSLNQNLDSQAYNSIIETFKEYKSLETVDNRLNREKSFLNSYITRQIDLFYNSFDFTSPEIDLATREAEMDTAIRIIEQQLFQAMTEWMFYDEVVLVNERLQLLNNNYSAFTREELVSIGDNKYSRFVGNTKYGSYVNNVWTFNPEYSYLADALSDYLKMELN